MKVCAGSPDTAEVHLCANLWSPLSQCLYLRKKYHIIIYRGLVLGGPTNIKLQLWFKDIEYFTNFIGKTLHS